MQEEPGKMRLSSLRDGRGFVDGDYDVRANGKGAGIIESYYRDASRL